MTGWKETTMFMHDKKGLNKKPNKPKKPKKPVTWGRLQVATPDFLLDYMDEGVAYRTDKFGRPIHVEPTEPVKDGDEPVRGYN
jgi:hypothetical protein